MARTGDHVIALAKANELSPHWGSRPMISLKALRARRKAERQNRKAGRA